ncbi:cytochrome P450 [Nocardia sp. N2S4-5]|uniref:cytochrome P450 n=1 Tax=Nocardia sp. N2S4-5 TaxID=3351565 RepID=UPI0037CEDCE7
MLRQRLGNYLARGGGVDVSPYLIHHRSDVYPDPEAFDPDRRDNAQPPSHAYLPFIAGPRKCVGDTFAMTEMVRMNLTARFPHRSAHGAVP